MKRWMRFLVTTIALAACAAFVGSCATNHYHARRPETATLQIEVEGQWKTVQRTVYEYPTEDDK